jgi:hypothetical protein
MKHASDVVHDGACLAAENPGKWLMCARAHANPDRVPVSSRRSLPLLGHRNCMKLQRNEIFRNSAVQPRPNAD